MSVEPENREVERFAAFTDGVMAIVITLLVLDVRLPEPAGELDDSRLWELLVAIWPKYLGYAVSFLVIGDFWFGHVRRFRSLRAADAGLLWFNILFLLAIGFVPFVTSVLSENSGRVATSLYAATMVVASLSLAATFHHAYRRGFVVGITATDRRWQLLRSLSIAGVFLCSIAIAWFDTDVAQLSWLLLIPASIFIRPGNKVAAGDPLGP